MDGSDSRKRLSRGMCHASSGDWATVLVLECYFGVRSVKTRWGGPSDLPRCGVPCSEPVAFQFLAPFHRRLHVCACVRPFFVFLLGMFLL